MQHTGRPKGRPFPMVFEKSIQVIPGLILDVDIVLC